MLTFYIFLTVIYNKAEKKKKSHLLSLNHTKIASLQSIPSNSPVMVKTVSVFLPFDASL